MANPAQKRHFSPCWFQLYLFLPSSPLWQSEFLPSRQFFLCNSEYPPQHTGQIPLRTKLLRFPDPAFQSQSAPSGADCYKRYHGKLPELPGLRRKSRFHAVLRFPQKVQSLLRPRSALRYIFQEAVPLQYPFLPSPPDRSRSVHPRLWSALPPVPRYCTEALRLHRLPDCKYPLRPGFQTARLQSAASHTQRHSLYIRSARPLSFPAHPAHPVQSGPLHSQRSCRAHPPGG